MQTWDEYHTRTLTLGIVSGPVEGILTLCVVYALTAVKGGGSFWQQSLMRSVGIEKHGFIPASVYELAWNEWYMVYGGLVLVFNTIARYDWPQTFQVNMLSRIARDAVYSASSPFNPHETISTAIANCGPSALNVFQARRGRGQRTRVALLGLLPFFVSWALIVTYLALQPQILHHHLIPFVLYVGLINAYSVGQMIVAHLTKSRFPFGNVLALPLAFGVIDSLGPVLKAKFGVGWPSALGGGTASPAFDPAVAHPVMAEAGVVYQVAFVFSCLGLALGVYGSFVVDVITSICDYLDIWCLTIKYPYLEREAGQAEDKRGKPTLDELEGKKGR